MGPELLANNEDRQTTESALFLFPPLMKSCIRCTSLSALCSHNSPLCSVGIQAARHRINSYQTLIQDKKLSVLRWRPLLLQDQDLTSLFFRRSWM